MKRRQITPLYKTAVCILTATILGCGGKQKQGVGENDCQAGIEDLKNTPDEKLCTFAALNRTEMRIVSLREDCHDVFNPAQQAFLSDKLTRAQQCVDKAQALEAKKRACSKRLESLESKKDCLNDACKSALSETEAAMDTCTAPELKGTYADDVKKLKSVFTERLAKGERLRSLVMLKDECGRTQERINRKNASAILGRIVNEILQTDALQNKDQSESQMGQSAQRALAACEGPIRAAVEWLGVIYETELNVKNIHTNKGGLKRRLKRVENEYRRLMKIDAPSLYPDIEKPLTTLMEQFDYTPNVPKAPIKPIPQRAENEPNVTAENEVAQNDATSKDTAETAEGEPAAAETEKTSGGIAGTDAPPTVKSSSPKNDSPECKALRKKAAQFEAKIKEYTRKKNKAKVSAYQKNLDKIQTKLTEQNCD